MLHKYKVNFDDKLTFPQWEVCWKAKAFVKEDKIGAGDFGRVFRVCSRVSLEPTLCEIFLEKVSILVPRWVKVLCSKNCKRAIQRSHRQGKKAEGGRKL